MNKNGPIVVVEDDMDDQAFIKEAFKELKVPNEILFFPNGVLAYDYLDRVPLQPFIILSDINMPMLSGFDLRDKVRNNEQLNMKCIPYLFFTTGAEQRHVIDAYSKSVQGFFTKPHRYEELVRVLRNIIEYWKDCHSPNVSV